jgi:hypothetical protein
VPSHRWWVWIDVLVALYVMDLGSTVGVLSPDQCSCGCFSVAVCGVTQYAALLGDSTCVKIVLDVEVSILVSRLAACAKTPWSVWHSNYGQPRPDLALNLFSSDILF